MKRLPFAELEAQRALMLQRLRRMPVSDEALHRSALFELESRLAHWWGGALPPACPSKTAVPFGRPVVVPAERSELWILRAVSPAARPAMFGVEADGAVFTVDDTGTYQIFVTGLSPLLDEIASICRQTTGGRKTPLIERAERFFTDLEANVEAATVVLEIKGRPTSGKPRGRSFLQRIVALLPWVDDEPPARARSTEPEGPPASHGLADAGHHPTDSTPELEAEEDLNARPVHQLVVDFDTGAWPASGVLKELGYKVGRSGLAPGPRRQILRQALTVELVATSEEAQEYLQEWGPPESVGRAAKIERCLAGFANAARRRTADMSEAIADWESDLEWFRNQYTY